MGAASWTILMYMRDRKWHLTEILSGAFAGLACITPASGYVLGYGAMIIGLVGGIISWFSVKIVKEKLKLDDVLDVFSLQGRLHFCVVFVVFFVGCF
jgi:Amt family ammonium transporter